MNNLPPDTWIPRLADALRKRQPRLAGADAMGIAGAQYDEALDVDPAEAAEIYALEQPPGEVGAPEQVFVSGDLTDSSSNERVVAEHARAAYGEAR